MSQLTYDATGDFVRYYVITEKPPERIAEAMQDREVVKGMTPVQVRLTVGAKEDYDVTPSKRIDREDGYTWEFQHRDVGRKQLIVEFDGNDTVTEWRVDA